MIEHGYPIPEQDEYDPIGDLLDELQEKQEAKDHLVSIHGVWGHPDVHELTQDIKDIKLRLKDMGVDVDEVRLEATQDPVKREMLKELHDIANGRKLIIKETEE